MSTSQEVRVTGILDRGKRSTGIGMEMCRDMIFSGNRWAIIFGKSIVLGHWLGRKKGRAQNIKSLLVGLYT